MFGQLIEDRQAPLNEQTLPQPRLSTAEIVILGTGTRFRRAQKAGAIPADTPIWLSRPYSFDPHNPLGKSLTRSAIWRLLEQDPSLEYKVENERVYILSNGADLSLIVPKYRHIPEIYPADMPAHLQSAFRLLGLAFLGLAPAGLGTLILAPLALLQTLRICRNRPLSHSDRIRVRIILTLAIILLATGFVFSYLFLIRL